MLTISQNDKNHRMVSTIAWKIVRAKKIVFVTGAGISCNAGIPDFRSSNGLYDQAQVQSKSTGLKGKDMFDVSVFNDESSTEEFFRFLHKMKCQIEHAQPTPTHEFIKLLDERKKLLRCYTQNIDGLESQLHMNVGLDTIARIIPLHGEMSQVRCVVCSKTEAWTNSHSRSFESGCGLECHYCIDMQNDRIARGKRRTGRIGILRPDIILYGEEHSHGDSIAKIIAKDLKSNPDMLVIIGTTLQIPGVKKLVKDAATKVHSKGGLVVLINASRLPKIWNSIIDVHLEGDCDFWVTQIKLAAHDWFKRQTLVTESTQVEPIVTPLKRKREFNDSKPKALISDKRQHSKGRRMAALLSTYAR